MKRPSWKNIAVLAEAAEDLLYAMRLKIWKDVEDREDVEDRSNWEVAARMEAALNAFGLPQPPYAEFKANLEDLLRSGLPPEEWRRVKGWAASAERPGKQ
jgi:hypothetical protein